MKSNILLSTTLASLLTINAANADNTNENVNKTPRSISLAKATANADDTKNVNKTPESSLLPPETQDTLQGISNALKYALQPFPQEFHELPDNTPSEKIVLESESKMGLREIKTTPQLVDLGDIDTGPKVNRLIKAILRGPGPMKK